MHRHPHQLGVSRTIVREVLRHLESEGLVSTQIGKGPIVAPLDADIAQQIYEVRGALESVAAHLCAESDDPTIVAALDAALAGIRDGYASSDMGHVLASTSEFYWVLFSKVNRHVAWDIVNMLTVRINHLRSMTIKTNKRDVEGPAQMAALVRAGLIRRRAEPSLVDVAIARWQAFTGEEAVLMEAGETFAALKAKRLGA